MHNKKLYLATVLLALVLGAVSIVPAAQEPPATNTNMQYENTLVLITPSNSLLLKAMTTAFQPMPSSSS